MANKKNGDSELLSPYFSDEGHLALSTDYVPFKHTPRINDPRKYSKRDAAFRFKTFSDKQKLVLTWWHPASDFHKKKAIICDGSVRAGKTLTMSLSFVMWAMDTFDGQKLGFAGKTIGALRRNVIGTLKQMCKALKYKVKENRADNYLTITYKGKVNYFYLFGGKDERSQDLIQGATLAGVFFDEVALMPQSFVLQATARCSVEGHKFWFNCNPASPYHWFYTDWLSQIEKRNALHIHFVMKDNLSLSAETIAEYESRYSGIFYRRFILGEWAFADGLIYSNFEPEKHKVSEAQVPEVFDKKFIGVDYGHTNATVFLLLGLRNGVLYVLKEYYHSPMTAAQMENLEKGEELRSDKAPSEYADDFIKFMADEHVNEILIDPAAKGFITELRKRGVKNIRAAINDVNPGITSVAVQLSKKALFVVDRCKNIIKEFATYAWDPKAQERGEDKPLKKNDHCMDALRYVVYWLFGRAKSKASGIVVGKSLRATLNLT